MIYIQLNSQNFKPVKNRYFTILKYKDRQIVGEPAEQRYCTLCAQNVPTVEYKNNFSASVNGLE